MKTSKEKIAIVGAGVSGLTCGLAFVELGYRTAIFAREIGQQTTSGAAAALWFPYDVEPADKVIPWALQTFQKLGDLARDSASGVCMVEVHQLSRTWETDIPEWAVSLGASEIPRPSTSLRPDAQEAAGEFASGFALHVPLMDTTVYLDYLASRFVAAGGTLASNACLKRLEEIDDQFNLVINCAGLGARELVSDAALEPHRGQVVIVPRIEGLSRATVCDDAPLMYVIPRTKDCVLGGTNEVSDDLAADPAVTRRIVHECCRALKIRPPKVLTERVGLRPFRPSGVRLERGCLRDGRAVIHNYGHGGSGFTLSWGCAFDVVRLAQGSLRG